MDTLSAFAMGAATRGKEKKVFDWHKAAKLINEHNAMDAVAGLSSDMEYTAGEILKDGKIVDRDETYTYLASTWATPVLVLDNDEIPCYVMESETNWDAETYWPESAIKMLDR
jgi:hypothetical protein